MTLFWIFTSNSMHRCAFFSFSLWFSLNAIDSFEFPFSFSEQLQEQKYFLFLFLFSMNSQAFVGLRFVWYAGQQ